MKRTQPFTRRVLVLVLVLGVGSLLSSLVFGLFGEEPEPASAGSDTFSKSALGHRAFVSLLESEDIPVRVSRFDSLARSEGEVFGSFGATS